MDGFKFYTQFELELEGSRMASPDERIACIFDRFRSLTVGIIHAYHTAVDEALYSRGSFLSVRHVMRSKGSEFSFKQEVLYDDFARFLHDHVEDLDPVDRRHPSPTLAHRSGSFTPICTLKTQGGKVFRQTRLVNRRFGKTTFGRDGRSSV